MTFREATMKTILSNATRMALCALTSCGGATPPPAPAPSTSASSSSVAEAPAAEERARVDILSPRAPAEIRLDGKSIGTTPITGYAMAPGRHDVTFVYGPGDEQTLSVNVKAGREATVKLDHVPPIKE